MSIFDVENNPNITERMSEPTDPTAGRTHGNSGQLKLGLACDCLYYGDDKLWVFELGKSSFTYETESLLNNGIGLNN